MEGQRHQYIPAASLPVGLPPPPPRHPPTQPQSMVPPPPPGPPPGTGYGFSSQQSWDRHPLSQGLPPPPPLPPSLAAANQNQHLTYNRQSTPLSVPLIPPSSESHPLTAATYIPGPDTFGVGIPPLDSHRHSTYDNANQSYVQSNANQSTHRKEAAIPPQSARYVSAPLILHDDVHELVSSSLPTTIPQNAQTHAAGRGPDSSELYPHNSTLGGVSPNEAAAIWPLDRVLLWLAQNGFSNDWQETFKSLELQGADFLELGHGSNGRPNYGKLHKVVYPQLAKECEKSGTGWDQAREREEGKRLRRLIRRIHDDGNLDSGIPIPRRQEHQQPQSASVPSDAGSEISPIHVHEPVSAHPGFGTAENSPGQTSGLQALHAGYQRQSAGQMRSVTLPISTSRESSALEPKVSEATPWTRLGATRTASASIGSDHQRQSLSLSSDGGGLPAIPFRPHEDSPQSGSPAAQHASLAFSGTTASSIGDPFSRYEHSRGNSSDSINGGSRVAPSAGSRYYESRKQGQTSARPSPQEPGPRQFGNENYSSYSKEPSKGFLTSFFKRKPPKGSDSGHPSPDEHGSESPTSPMYIRQQNGSYLPFTKSDYNASDTSLADRLPTAPSSESASTRAKSGQKTKKWIFVTSDLLNYRLVDITDIDTVDTLRTVICSKLGIFDWPSAQIFLTEPGQTEHEEPMNDTALWVCQGRKADPVASLKFYVRGPQISIGNPPQIVHGLGIPIPEKNAVSPTTGQQVHRKPLDDEAISRISQQNQNPSPSSPLSSRQPASSVHPTERGESQLQTGGSAGDGTPEPAQLLGSDKADLLARYEEHQREVERKQKAYRISKLPPVQPRKDMYGETGYRREGVIDFDTPRISPYDNSEKKNETLIPRRKPPFPPPESSTLTKVNSLSKRNVDRVHPPAPNQSRGLAAAIASVGKMSSSIGTPSPSAPPVPVPQALAPGVDGLNADSASVYPAQRSPDDKRVIAKPVAEQNANVSTRNAEQPPPADSSVQERPQLQSRKSYGPEFDFEEAKVSFESSPQPQEESDEESDDGLFAIPLTTSKKQDKAQKAAPSTPSVSKEPKKPTLKLETDKRKSKASVAFKSPTIGTFMHSPNEPGDVKESFYSPSSPQPEGLSRRRSFAGGDVWADRPPVEGVIENLDEFFPDIDLDAPYLEGNPASPPPSPAAKGPSGSDPNLKGRDDPPPYTALPGGSGSDTLGSDESTLRPGDTNVVARRNVGRSGGLTRMKSIREVAKGANQTHRNRSIHTSGNQKSGDILRRKSTKMFGARIMQISPKPGKRLDYLEPLPQNNSSQGSQLQRQPTFRIIRGQLIGKGTYGRVYLGMNADNGEVLAVKQVEINPRLVGQDTDRVKEMVAAMDHEIDTMQHLEHPNIVQYLGCERGEFSISIYLEYISGGSIGSCLRKHGKFEESVVKSLTRQTLSGLAYLHDKGILHRDMKADNILLDLDGTCKISDFGISKKSDNIYGNDSSNSMQGSVFWMAPEVIQSQGQGYSAKVDIWSLGCVVLEMFAGRRPWSKEEAIGAIFKLGSLNQAPPIPDDVSMNISPEALAFMYDCFTIDTYERPTAETLLTQHPFCIPDPSYNFLDTELYAKIRHVL
ncbi:hypothetical protein MPDQ_007741 [Monascus purpureus]|uniref:Mitogen-activated protein kinase kinae kinase bck1 n=1 Tax=Monascus purpureus TaxID=5098 RepID=A0A507QRP8_MONPU|nr:hypothetical protein MPDQ_007741 [Monascus purpureus]